MDSKLSAVMLHNLYLYQKDFLIKNNRNFFGWLFHLTKNKKKIHHFSNRQNQNLAKHIHNIYLILQSRAKF